IAAMRERIHYGAIYFHQETEPHMSITIAGERSDSPVTMAEINLKFIWDLVSQIKVGQTGKAYVIDAQGRLIAHPDISLVLRNIDLSHIVERHSSHSIQLPEPADGGEVIQDMQGRSALAGFAPVGHVGWLVCVELPVAEAYAPLVESIARSLAILVVALGLAMFAG